MWGLLGPFLNVIKYCNKHIIIFLSKRKKVFIIRLFLSTLSILIFMMNLYHMKIYEINRTNGVAFVSNAFHIIRGYASVCGRNHIMQLLYCYHNNNNCCRPIFVVRYSHDGLLNVAFSDALSGKYNRDFCNENLKTFLRTALSKDDCAEVSQELATVLYGKQISDGMKRDKITTLRDCLISRHFNYVPAVLFVHSVIEHNESNDDTHVRSDLCTMNDDAKISSAIREKYNS
jgi:hypothetical protein